MFSDLRQAARSLLKSPGYTAIALLTLALCIGVNTSMYSVVDALLFRSAPFPESDRLVQVESTTPTGETRTYSYLELREIRDQQPSFAGLTTLCRTAFGVSEPGQPAERIAGATVSEDFFATFRVSPQLGRAFAPEEFHPGRNNVVLLSHGYWQQHYGGTPDAIGRTMRLDGEVVTIIGVMPPAFDYRLLWERTAVWRPLNFTRDQLEWRDYRTFELVGRLAPGVTPGRVTTELVPVVAQQAKLFPESYAGVRYTAVPLHQALMDTLSKRISWMLLGLAGVVLLIACANLANLQLARATAGLRELAIRAALGASRRRLIRHQMLESLLLSGCGGAIGVALAFGLNRLIDRTLVVGGGTGGLHLGLDPKILLLTFAISLGTGLLFGFAPAWLASRTDVNTALKQQARGSTPGGGHHRVRQALIVAEVALALVLLGGAAILQRGFAQMLERRTGWDTEHAITAQLPIPETRKEFETEPQRAVLFRRLEARLIALPGVEQAAIATSVPIFSYNGDRQILKEEQSPGDPNLPAAFHVMVTSRYFAALGIPLVEGRLFDLGLKREDPRTIVINQSLAQRLWPRGGAIGQRIGSMDNGKPYWAEVIGVVRDVDGAANTRDPSTPFQIYKPLFQEPWSNVHIILRGPAAASLGEPLRRAIAEVDADLAASGAGTVRQTIDQQQHNLVLAGKTLTAFALLGLVLASVGLYGVISNLVAQRTGEFGIRLALGARPADVLGLVLRHGLILCAIGAGIGLVGAFALGRLLASLMPRLASVDPLALFTVTVTLFVTAVVACWLPARRATKVDPMIALRAE
ncbi:MAG: ABC transporter permease [Opitutaceae bacterium]|nr:ABC transporter permease [Opitutaceae bacterium]